MPSIAASMWSIFVYEPGEDPRHSPTQTSDQTANGLINEIIATVESEGGIRNLRMPPTAAGAQVGFELIIGTAGSLLATGAVWLGAKLHAFFKQRKSGASGDVHALLFVAIYHLNERYPEIVLDPKMVEYLGEEMPKGVPARPIRAVYLYRMQDTASERVFLLEVSSEGELVTLAERPTSKIPV